MMAAWMRAQLSQRSSNAVEPGLNSPVDEDRRRLMRLSVIVVRINLENIIGKHFRQPDPYIIPGEKSSARPPDFPPPQWKEAGTGDLSLITT